MSSSSRPSAAGTEKSSTLSGDLLRAPVERDALALRALGIAPPSRRHVLRFYELRWILSEIAEYVSRFTSPHTGNTEDLEKRDELARYLS
jgi:hypothetical protein